MKTFLTFLAVLGFCPPAHSQVCIPNPLAVLAGIPGLYPLPTDSLPPGALGVAYSETITVIVPSDTTLDLSAITGIPGLPTMSLTINYEKLNSISGLPSGIAHACNPSNCEWPGSGNGCIKLSGTPTQNGPFTVSLDLDLNVEVPAGVPIIGGSPLDVPLPITYDLVIEPLVVGLEQNSFPAMTMSVSPNPAGDFINVNFDANVSGEFTIGIYDGNGRNITVENGYAAMGINTIQLNTAAFPSGIYLLRLSSQSGMEGALLNIIR